MTPTNPLPGFLQMLVGAGARHALTGVAGFLVGTGALQSDQQAQFVSIAAGIVIWLAGYGWSALQKKAVADLPQPIPADDPPH